MLFSNLNNLKYRQGNTTLLKQSKMAEDKTKSSPDEAGGNDSKVFSLFCLKSILTWLGDGYILMTLNTEWWPSLLSLQRLLL